MVSQWLFLWLFFKACWGFFKLEIMELLLNFHSQAVFYVAQTRTRTRTRHKHGYRDMAIFEKYGHDMAGTRRLNN